VRDELGRFAPAELVAGPAVDAGRFDGDTFLAEYDDAAFDLDAATERVASYFGSADALAADAEVRACGALLAYAEYTRGGEGHQRLDYLNHLTRYDPGSTSRWMPWRCAASRCSNSAASTAPRAPRSWTYSTRPPVRSGGAR